MDIDVIKQLSKHLIVRTKNMKHWKVEHVINFVIIALQVDSSRLKCADYNCTKMSSKNVEAINN